MMIFVFGSNLAGRHGAGAALYARRYYGAIYGQGKGRQGNSYGIPTKDQKLSTLPLDVIRQEVNVFIKYAQDHPHEKFFVTRIGCGLAGYKNEDIAPMFLDAPDNCVLDNAWLVVLDSLRGVAE